MSTPLPPFSPVTLSFVDRDAEVAFWRSFARSRKASLKIGIVLLGVLYAAFGIVDFFVFQDHLPALLFVRYAVAVPLMVLAWPIVLSARFAELYERRIQEILLGLGVIATGGILAMGSQIARSATIQQMIVGSLGMLVTLTFLYGFTQLRFVYMALLGTVTTLTGLFYLMVFLDAPLFLWSALVTFGLAVNVSGFWIGRTVELLARRDFVQKEATIRERERSERLLANVLPAEIARRLQADDADLGAERAALAERHEAVTVLVADLVGFTPLADRLPPVELARLLDRIFSAFDALAEEHGVEKIKTLGDAWIAAAGVPHARADHAAATARLALAMLDALAGLDVPVAIRIGIHSGPAVAGVIGRTRFAYDLWGEAVEGAKTMEQGGAPGKVRVSTATAALLPQDLPVHLAPTSTGDGAAWLVRPSA